MSMRIEEMSGWQLYRATKDLLVRHAKRALEEGWMPRTSLDLESAQAIVWPGCPFVSNPENADCEKEDCSEKFHYEHPEKWCDIGDEYDRASEMWHTLALRYPKLWKKMVGSMGWEVEE